MGGDEGGGGEALRGLHRPQPRTIGGADDGLDLHSCAPAPLRATPVQVRGRVIQPSLMMPRLGAVRAGSIRAGDLLDGVGHGQGGNDGVVSRPDRGHDAAHDLGWSEGARGVVDEDNGGVGMGGQRRSQAEGDAGLPGVGRPGDDLDGA